MTGVGLYQTIKELLGSAGLDILDSRWQWYDGAGVVAGKDKRLQTQVCRKNPKALYTHCASHRLNVAVVTSCKEVRKRWYEYVWGAACINLSFSPKNEKKQM